MNAQLQSGFAIGIQSRVPWDDYAALEGTNITRLKLMAKSPLHYAYGTQAKTPALSLGIAAHCAVLEPERFARQFAVWDRRTDGGRMSPRNGRVWDDFCEIHSGKTVITADECDLARAIQCAVRGNALAMRYLEAGDPEVTLQWVLGERQCKGRVDWLTGASAQPVLVGLKTARDCRHMVFGSSAARLCYHWQWAYYADGYHAIKGVNPKVVEIVVESAAPHAVAVYVINDDILAQGREEYERALARLTECELDNQFPGPQLDEEELSLPSWVYPSGDELGDLGLEG